MHTLKSVATATALLLAATLAASGHAHAYACKTSPHQATATDVAKITAQGRSKKNWSSTAKSAFGLSWSVWSIAANRSVSCNKLASGKWTCLASGKPCNYVVP
jgi:hypothetical protein